MRRLQKSSVTHDSAHGRGVDRFEVTICDLKSRTWRSALRACAFHGTVLLDGDLAALYGAITKER